MHDLECLIVSFVDVPQITLQHVWCIGSSKALIRPLFSARQWAAGSWLLFEEAIKVKLYPWRYCCPNYRPARSRWTGIMAKWRHHALDINPESLPSCHCDCVGLPGHSLLLSIKCLNKHRIDWHEIVTRHSWSPDDESYLPLWSLGFPLAPPWGWLMVLN